MADIVLYQFLELTAHCYGVDMTCGSGEIVRICEEEKSCKTFTMLSGYKPSSEGCFAGEVASPQVLEKTNTWIK